MKSSLQEIAELTAKATTQPMDTALPGVMIIQGQVPAHQLAAVYEPILGFTIQGQKTISIGDQVIHAKAPSYYVIPMDVPATGQVHQGENGAPYLSVGLRLNRNSLLDLLKDCPDLAAGPIASNDFSACEALPDFVDAWLRLLRLLRTPKAIPALAPVYEREILYRVLQGPHAWRLLQFCYANGAAPGIHRSIQWIRGNSSKTIDVKNLAVKSGMGVTTFHRHFKQITGLTPIQFQKQLRLLEARKLLVFGDLSVSEAAFQVGYESPSQFNREYSRLFGASPARDTARVRELERRRKDRSLQMGR